MLLLLLGNLGGTIEDKTPTNGAVTITHAFLSHSLYISSPQPLLLTLSPPFLSKFDEKVFNIEISNPHNKKCYLHYSLSSSSYTPPSP
jgi:hypothetical protein